MATYVAGLCQMTNAVLGGPYDGISFEAVSNVESVKKAKEWAASEEVEVRDDSWLQVMRDGKSVASLKPGEF